MENQNQNRYLILLIIILALIMHMVFLSLFLIQTYKDDINNFLTTQVIDEEKNDQQDGQDQNKNQDDLKEEYSQEIAAMRQKTSDFGMPVTFEMLDEDEPDKLQEAETQKPEKEQEIISQEIQESKPEAIIEEKLTEEIKPEKLEAKEEPAQEQKQKIEPTPKKKKAPFMDRLMNNNKRQVFSGLSTFIDQGGEDLISRNGNNNIKADAKQLQEASYINKIGWAIQNAWNIKRQKLNFNKNMITTVGVTIVIDKAGNLISVNKTKSSDVKEIDDILLESIIYASPFPPIPKHLKRDTFIYNPVFYITITNAKNNNFISSKYR